MELALEKLVVNLSNQEIARVSEGALSYSCESPHWQAACHEPDESSPHPATLSIFCCVGLSK
jgi:hypothetical protein